MGRFDVTLPVVAKVVVYGVVADSAEDAIERAVRSLGGPFHVSAGELEAEGSEAECVEWEAMTRLMRGNVSYAPINQASAKPSDPADYDDEDD